jgi:AcrR family transcriptional regulator
MSAPKPEQHGARPRRGASQPRGRDLRTGRGARQREPGGTNDFAAVQRARILTAAAQVIGTDGYGGFSPARIVSRARVSRRTFYDLFEDREDCFLALFDQTLERASKIAAEAASGEQRWQEQIRAGLSALLQFAGDEPVLGSLLIADALRAGPKVLARRANVLATLHAVVDQGRSQTKPGREPPPLTAEGTVGAVLAILHARTLEANAPPPIELLNHLMASIVLPYLGAAAAARELERPRPSPSSARANGQAGQAEVDALEGIPMRITYRTLRVLAAIAAQPGASNREIAGWAGVVDPGQISKLLARLARLELISNTGEGQPQGEPNAWMLTVRGAQVEEAVHVHERGSTDNDRQ